MIVALKDDKLLKSTMEGGKLFQYNSNAFSEKNDVRHLYDLI